MKRVEIFRTQVQHTQQAKHICEILAQELEDTRVNFDLEDCDKVLRIESNSIDPRQIIQIMETLGFFCDLIPGSGFQENTI